jgi:hypothetical protein
MSLSLVAYDPSVAYAFSNSVRKARYRATSPRCAQGGRT